MSRRSPSITRSNSSPVNADTQLDAEVAAKLQASIATLKAADRLTLLTLAEHPRLLAAIEGIVSASEAITGKSTDELDALRSSEIAPTMVAAARRCARGRS